MRVRAFSAEASLRLAQAIVGASEKLINDLSVRARRDAVGQAEIELAAAEAGSRLRSPRSASSVTKKG